MLLPEQAAAAVVTAVGVAAAATAGAAPSDAPSAAAAARGGARRGGKRGKASSAKGPSAPSAPASSGPPHHVLQLANKNGRDPNSAIELYWQLGAWSAQLGARLSLLDALMCARRGAAPVCANPRGCAWARRGVAPFCADV